MKELHHLKLTGNTILITGGTSGIGLGLALRLHAAGNKIIIAGRRKALLDEIASDHPGIDAIELDVGEPDSIARAAETLQLTHPELNVLINNAGIMFEESVLDPADVRVAEDHVTVNLLGTIRMTYAFLPQLVGESGGTVINVTSSLAFVPYPATPTYSATKAALHSFSDSLRIQVAASGTQVIEVVPPAVRTDLMNQTDSAYAMPLDEYLTEVMSLLETKPDADEIIVARAEAIRHAFTQGDYKEMLSSFSSM